MTDGISLFIYFRHKVNEDRITLSMYRQSINMSRRAVIDMIAMNLNSVKIHSVDLEENNVSFYVANKLWTYKRKKKNKKTIDKMKNKC